MRRDQVDDAGMKLSEGEEDWGLNEDCGFNREGGAATPAAGHPDRDVV